MVRVTALNDKYTQQLLDVVLKYEGEECASQLQKSVQSIKPTEEILVCIDVETDNVIGYSKTTALLHGVLQLDYIYVIPPFRRDTNGSIILVAVYNRAVNQMVVGLLAECLETNDCGNAFLQKRGFLLGKNENGVNFYTKSLMHMYIPHKHDD